MNFCREVNYPFWAIDQIFPLSDKNLTDSNLFALTSRGISQKIFGEGFFEH